MKASNEKFKSCRRTFGWVFIISSVIFVLSFPLGIIFGGGIKGGGPIHDLNKLHPEPQALIIAAISLLISLASLMGFLFLSIFLWRRESRETRHVTPDLKKKEFEFANHKREPKQSGSNPEEGFSA